MTIALQSIFPRHLSLPVPFTFPECLTHLDHVELVQCQSEQHNPVVDQSCVGIQVAFSEVVLGAPVDLRPHDVVDDALDLGRVDVDEAEGRDIGATVL